VRTRESPGRRATSVDVGRREPDERRMPSWDVSGGLVVGAQESRAHQEEDRRRRPLAFGKTGTKGTSVASAAPGDCPVERAPWEPTLHGSPWRPTKGGEPEAVRAARPVRRGGWEDVPKGNASCPYPVHGVSSFLLPTHADRTRMAVPHAPLDVAKCFRCVPDATGAPTPTAQAHA
jgi:hypothetical protein